ncbi:hypothetical protein DXV65_12025 [Pseudomonas fluorescens]|nr:hypothetical protein DXV65_12025 [Pseudomonas fluorescens]
MSFTDGLTDTPHSRASPLPHKSKADLGFHHYLPLRRPSSWNGYRNLEPSRRCRGSTACPCSACCC